MKETISFYIFILIQVLNCVNGERTHNKMYESIAGASCFRRLNGTHQTGCSSSFSGSVGVIHEIKTASDFDFVLNNPTSLPYAPVIPPHLFTKEHLLRLKEKGKKYISVVIVINLTAKMTNYSHELPCPNPYSGLTTNQESCDPNIKESTWNPYGTGLLFEDFPFPIYYVADPDEVKKIQKCFEDFNNFDFDNHCKRSLCSIEVNSFMSAAVSSEVCIRRTHFLNNLSPTKYCDPLEGKNIYATLFPRKPEVQKDVHLRSVNESEKFILISCRLDTTSMFDGVGLGAMDSLVSYAALINVAHVLTKLLPQQKNTEKNILFMIFNGESYDYIGSQKFVYDLGKKMFPHRKTQRNPISIENIEYMIDLGTLDDVNSLTLYHATDFPFVDNLLKKLQTYNDTFNLNLNFKAAKTLNLPPTSAQSFLRDNISFPAIILNSKPTNQYYHSIYDDAVNIGFLYHNTSQDFSELMKNEAAFSYFQPDTIQMKIRNISSALALSIYTILTGENYTGDLISNPVLADEFLYCFLHSADCPLFKAASMPNSPPGRPEPPSRYISVQGAAQEAAGWSYRLLGYIASQVQTNFTKENCTNLPLHWFSGFSGKGECRLTTQNNSHALSPAFLDEDYDWKSGRYSTWTESTWPQINARIFLRPSKVHEAVTLAIGFVVMVISFVIIFLMNSRSEVLFEDCPSPTITEPAAC